MSIVNIELNNTHVIKKSIFKEFKNASLTTTYYWRHEDRLIGWNDTNHDRTYWYDVDIRIEHIVFENATETYRLYAGDEYVAGDLLELSYVTDDQGCVEVMCAMVSVWD